ncbi:AAA family ATPase [Candidatus Poriferisocius sp.]|uniref:AAA family ATPase n=1 Tax=Candidatus Poriferisocius sp. TaxID=3101276 RepID=UPI003B013FDA
MVTPRLTRLAVSNFRSLEKVDIPLGTLTVMIGPNGSGKTNVLNLLRFLASTVRFDLAATIEQWGGLEHVKRRSSVGNQKVTIEVSGLLTEHASDTALDQYKLSFHSTPKGALKRSEEFTFKRTKGRGRRINTHINVSGRQVKIRPEGEITGTETDQRELATEQSTGLSILPRLSDEEGGEGIRSLADFLSSIRVLEPNVDSARWPSRLVFRESIADDADNLSSALYNLYSTAEESFNSLVEELRICLPGLDAIEFLPVGGPGRGVIIALKEKGLTSPIELTYASFGTIRLLALLTALHEPNPPPFTAIEEVDHGLHPYALDVLVDRLRAASRNTQILITTHSPTLVNRLEPSELVICNRDPKTSASIIPYKNSATLASAQEKSSLPLGELWFAGALGGVPDNDT